MASSNEAADGGEKKKKKGGEALKEVSGCTERHTERHPPFHQLDPPPGFLGPRVEMFERLKREYDEWIASLSAKTYKLFVLASLNTSTNLPAIIIIIINNLPCII